VNSRTDQQLLRDYAERRSEAGFGELVRRHVDLIYSAALRMVCHSPLAEDVTQGAFVALARSAPQLTEHAVLSGWLHRTAQNIAAQTVRTDVRRRAREREAPP
jgi:DNA-directed RNA polymerase specialized sigma24 family protein